MLGVVRSLGDLDAASVRIELLGYAAMGAYGIEARRYFRKEDSEGRRTHHLHVYETSAPHIDRHPAFRNYLRSHPHKAAEYSALKAEIVNSVAPYQNTKESLVQQIQAEALAWWRTAG